MTGAFALVGSVLFLAALAAILRVDQSWTHRVRQCCRCLHSWPGLDELCPRCQARGRDARHGLIAEAPEHGHDFQGWMDTAPVPVVPPIPSLPLAQPRDEAHLIGHES